ncbi:2-iminoacetate synthase ThiH [Pedobacter cryoconitis]|nr:2-iminoacetate synthase ThiH [Pedobacter cryoconitis]
MARAWYAYLSGNPLLISSYTLISYTPTCLNGCNICAIFALNGGASPSVLSTRLRAYIADAIVTQVAQPPMHTIYVRVKPGC